MILGSIDVLSLRGIFLPLTIASTSLALSFFEIISSAIKEALPRPISGRACPGVIRPLLTLIRYLAEELKVLLYY